MIPHAEPGRWRVPALAGTTALVAIPIGLWSLLLLALPYSATLALALKLVLWGTLALAYPWLERANPAAILGLDKAPHLGWLFGGAVFVAGYSLLIHGGRPDLPPISAFYLVSAVIVSPVVEEAAFRGVLLRRLDSMVGTTGGNLATAALFVLYHVPLWLARGSDISAMGCLWVACFSVWMGYVLHRKGSLWTCIGIHALNNLMLGN